MRRIVFLGLLVIMVSCGGSSIPKDVMEKEKMQAVLWDVLQADDFVREYMTNKDSTLDDTAENITMYERVFRLHGTNREEFERSYNYYRQHPALMKEVLDSMYNQFTRQPVAVYNPPVPPVAKPVIDSAIHPTPVDSVRLQQQRDSARRILLDTGRRRIKERVGRPNLQKM